MNATRYKYALVTVCEGDEEIITEKIEQTMEGIADLLKREGRKRWPGIRFRLQQTATMYPIKAVASNGRVLVVR